MHANHVRFALTSNHQLQVPSRTPHVTPSPFLGLKSAINRATTDHHPIMSYAARLDRLVKLETVTDDAEEMSQFTRLPLQEMGKTKIDFGEAHNGETYDHAWKNHKAWLKFILNKYGESTKLQHRKLIHYTMMKIERAELEQGVPEQLPVKPKVLRASPKPKARLPDHPQTEEADQAEVESFIEVDYVDLQNQQNQENIEALQARMLHMEGAITEILGYIRPQQ